MIGLLSTKIFIQIINIDFVIVLKIRLETGTV